MKPSNGVILAMTSLKQIEANRLNALKSTGPRTDEGKQRSRQNALRHGLTAETVITALENAADYQVFEATICAEYQPRTATARELVARLASVLWRLRRSTSIETGLLQIQGELMQSRNTGAPAAGCFGCPNGTTKWTLQRPMESDA